jgi:hypothetical protein
MAGMGEAKRCVVILGDAQDDIQHRTEVMAESVYEAAIRVLHRFRKEEWSQQAAGEMMFLHVEVHEAPIVHQVKVKDVDDWLARPGGSPREMALREKLKKL